MDELINVSFILLVLNASGNTAICYIWSHLVYKQFPPKKFKNIGSRVNLPWFQSEKQLEFDELS